MAERSAQRLDGKAAFSVEVAVIGITVGCSGNSFLYQFLFLTVQLVELAKSVFYLEFQVFHTAFMLIDRCKYSKKFLLACIIILKNVLTPLKQLLKGTKRRFLGHLENEILPHSTIFFHHVFLRYQ